jgi:hypothetical protein
MSTSTLSLLIILAGGIAATVRQKVVQRVAVVAMVGLAAAAALGFLG